MIPFILLTLVAVGQTAVMFAVELNRTHATHPDWPGHARFHLVWQNLTTAAFTALTLLLLWYPGPARRQRFFFAAAITTIPLISFLIAHSGKHLYSGTLADPGGVPPLRLRNREFDGNMAGVLIALTALFAAVSLEIYALR